MILYTPNSSYEKNPFPDIFTSMVRIERASDIKPGGVLILWGGEDIAPSLYGERANKMVYRTLPSARDLFELELLKYCFKRCIPVIGICRGAQLLCVATGGKLRQHINNHHLSHKVTLLDEDNKSIMTNSSHHQMMKPLPDAKILAIAEGTSGLDEFNNEIKEPQVNEVVWFPKHLGLGIQPHPEWEMCPTPFVDYCKRKIKEYVCQAVGATG